MDKLNIAIRQAPFELFKRGDFSCLGLFPKQRKALEFLHPSNKVGKTKEFVNGIRKMLLYGGGAGGGKSWLGCEFLLLMSISYPGIKSFIARTELKRIKTTTYQTFLKVCKKYSIENEIDFNLNSQDNVITFTTGSKIDLLDVAYQPRDPFYERFGSSEYTIGFEEEGGEIHGMAHEVLSSRIGRHLNLEFGIPPELIITANPKKNWMHRYFYKPYKAKTLEKGSKFIPAFYFDNPRLDPAYVAGLKAIKDKVLKERYEKGNWDYDDDTNKIFEYDKLLQLPHNRIDESKTRYMSIDVAGEGKDLAVFMVWEGLRVIHIKIEAKTTGKQTIDISNKLADTFRVQNNNIIFDSDGIGSFTTSYMVGSRAFHGGSSPIQKTVKMVDRKEFFKQNYINLRSQCYFKLSELVNEQKIVLDCEDYFNTIVEELDSIENYKPDDERKMRVTPKKDIKEKIGRSPDFADAIMMRMIFELKERKVFKTVIL